MSDLLDLARVGLCGFGLAVAAYTDLKTREVPDGLWYTLGACALVLFALSLNDGSGAMAPLLAAPVGLLLLVALTGGEVIPVFPGAGEVPDDFEPTPRQRLIIRADLSITAALIAGALALFWFAHGLDIGPRSFLAGAEAQAYSVSIMFGVAVLLFQFSLISGGADAKALMVLAALFPLPPALPGLPLLHPSGLALAIVPFSLAVFFNGAILLVLAKVPVFPLLGKRAGKIQFPDSLFGYEKAVGDIRLDREWILGTVVDGAWARRLMPTHGSHSDEAQKAALEYLRQKGTPRVFVTPKLPFMVYLLGGFVMALLVSSPLYFVGA